MPYVVQEQRQLLALVSPVRQAIVDVVAARGPSTVREVGIELSRPASALYHHVRALCAVGLLTTSSAPQGRGRPSVTVDVPGRPLAIKYQPEGPRSAAPMRRIVAAMARAATRDFARAYRPGVSTAGEARELWASRAESWLSDGELRAANRHLAALIRLLSASSRASDTKRRRYSLTFVLAPSRLKSARKERVERRKETRAT